MTKEEYLMAFKDGLVRQGWIQPGDEAAAREIDDWAEEHLEIAAAFPAGTALADQRRANLATGRVPRTSGRIGLVSPG